MFFYSYKHFHSLSLYKGQITICKRKHSAAFTSVSSKERSLQSPSQTLLSFVKWALFTSKNIWWLQKIMTNTRWYRISRRRFRTMMLFFDWTIKNGNWIWKNGFGKKNRTFFRFFLTNHAIFVNIKLCFLSSAKLSFLTMQVDSKSSTCGSNPQKALIMIILLCTKYRPKWSWLWFSCMALQETIVLVNQVICLAPVAGERAIPSAFPWGRVFSMILRQNTQCAMNPSLNFPGFFFYSFIIITSTALTKSMETDSPHRNYFENWNINDIGVGSS